MATEDFESIIRSKNWEQLSAGERERIREIAPDEAAFRTAKQILLLAAEGRGVVPQLTGKIRYMPPLQSTRKKTAAIWYGAALLLLALSTGIWWYSQRAETVLPAPVVVKHAPRLPAQSLPDTIAVPQHTAAETPSLAVKNKTKQVSPKKETAQPTVPVVNEPQGDHRVFLAANEPALVDLVVEMY